jgi:signal transduction histidine kinase
VVESDRETSRFVRETLASDFRTECAANGREGLDKALRLRPDLILSDVMMPGVSGARIVQEIRARPELDAIPVVMLTAWTDDSLRARVLREGAQDCLLKPFSAEELRARVGNLVSMKRTREILQREVAGRSADLETLAAQVASRTRELARSNVELERFGHVASHDMQEPLRMVASYVELLERRYGSRLDSDARQFMAYAAEGAKRMQGLIRDLLAYSRAGRAEQAFESVDCSAPVAAALENLRTAIEESGAVVEVGELPEVWGHPSALTQLFQNLIENAIKFRSREPPRIRIAAERRGEEWEVSVRDNGIGIDPRLSGRIFEVFQRLHDRAAYPGNGIGLPIVQRIVEQHRGRIWVESKPGLGSTFRFTLPVRRSQRGNDANALRPHAPGRG